jgi:hypothetical protein
VIHTDLISSISCPGKLFSKQGKKRYLPTRREHSFWSKGDGPSQEHQPNTRDEADGGDLLVEGISK